MSVSNKKKNKKIRYSKTGFRNKQLTTKKEVLWLFLFLILLKQDVTLCKGGNRPSSFLSYLQKIVVEYAIEVFCFTLKPSQKNK